MRAAPGGVDAVEAELLRRGFAIWFKDKAQA
jgi:hypothetical protein